MKKKLYIQPEMDVVIMDRCILLAGSTIQITDETGDIENQDAPLFGLPGFFFE